MCLACGQNLGPDREQGYHDPVPTVCKADRGVDRQNTERRAWSRVERNPVKEGLERKHTKGVGESPSMVEGGACPKRAFAKLERACSWGGERGEMDGRGRAGFRRAKEPFEDSSGRQRGSAHLN